VGSGGALLRQQKQTKRKNFHSLKKFLGRRKLNGLQKIGKSGFGGQ